MAATTMIEGSNSVRLMKLAFVSLGLLMELRLYQSLDREVFGMCQAAC